MATTKFTVVFEDGTSEIFKVRPKDILRIERESGGLSASVESSYKLAWMASGTKDGFEEWLDTVEDIEPVDEDTTPESNPT
jgi:hypothetical protein